MIRWFLSGGVIMWPLLSIALGIAWIAVRTTARLFRDPPPSGDLQRKAGAVLFWGTIALILGGVGTVAGLVVIARAVIAAGHVAMPIVWGGIALTLIPLLFGIAVFLGAGTAALALGYLGRMTAARALDQMT
jgi:hypothetical protein